LLDDGKYVNHEGINPTSTYSYPGKEGCAVITRDLEPGEEITENYLSYDRIPWVDELDKEYDIDMTFVYGEKYI